ncbi:hypothetical protein BD289DRAFT_191659 [Coniella lustricola]|uniref:Uncharacterized protein n=1 Tax=Coniella lustricola TaxID=2025994 RepID=A0A2T3AM18_9PEZI|nr:hypothetical protein BD289DRAFT_191659 [Coniella lustricola]
MGGSQTLTEHRPSCRLTLPAHSAAQLPCTAQRSSFLQQHQPPTSPQTSTSTPSTAARCWFLTHSTGPALTLTGQTSLVLRPGAATVPRTSGPPLDCITATTPCLSNRFDTLPFLSFSLAKRARRCSHCADRSAGPLGSYPQLLSAASISGIPRDWPSTLSKPICSQTEVTLDCHDKQHFCSRTRKVQQ